MKLITILGSTGSIGQNTLDVIQRHPQKFQVYALTARQNILLLLQQCLQFKPHYAVVADAEAAQQLRQWLQQKTCPTEVLQGEAALLKVVSAPQVEIVMAAIVGAVGLLPTLAAAQAGKRILLANKEALVMAGALLIEAVRKHQAELLPIDSEHNAIFQCLPQETKAGDKPKGVQKIILTASGGAVRDLPLEQLAQVTAAQACTHPNWKMGQKITVDSATMMNKVLEVIEAHYLFGLEARQIEVVLHPQSIVHSLVEYTDGSMLAQLGNPDMRVPIAHALAWPERIESGVALLDLIKTQRLDFAPLSKERYPALQLARLALQLGGTAPAILNAANEVAVAAFLANKIAFTDIAQVNQRVLQNIPAQPALDLPTILAADKRARQCAEEVIPAVAFA